MHSALVASSFIVMLLLPCIVAMRASTASESQSE